MKPVLFVALLFLMACSSQPQYELNDETLASLGRKFEKGYSQSAAEFRGMIEQDSINVEALIGLAESNIINFIFGFTSREETIPEAKMALQRAWQIDSLSSRVNATAAKLSFLDWEWEQAKIGFEKAIQLDPKNLDARHWYSLWFISMKQFDKAMLHSDTLMTMDPEKNYLIGRGSLVYFQHQFKELKDLMLEATGKNPQDPWGHDWLGMAYNGLADHENALSTYFKAFELSDGTVEVGGGLGHALGEAGEVELAKKMTAYYEKASQDNYLPPVQRAFIHIGIKEYDKALELLEQAYNEKSWFIIFMQIEPWLDPLRNDERFTAIMERMQFPD
ncbi:MAG: hypothetical protein RJQ09_03670 [Cyclobacteriaceae bacterium]